MKQTKLFLGYDRERGPGEYEYSVDRYLNAFLREKGDTIEVCDIKFELGQGCHPILLIYEEKINI